MVNDSNSLGKAKDDDVGNSRKKLSGGKNDSSGSMSGGDASGMRRLTRSQNNSSSVSLRKSQRLEKRTPEKPSPSLSSKKKAEKPSPLRRSVRESKSHSPISKGVAVEKGSPSSKGSKQQNKGSNTLAATKEKRQKQDKTLKEIAQEVKEKGRQTSGAEVGVKRKKRLDARDYRDMFKPLKKNKPSESESVKKNRLDDSGDSGPEKVGEGEQELSDGDESKGDSAKDLDGDAGDSNSCEIEDGEGLLVSGARDVCSPSSPGNEAAQNSDNFDEVPANGSMMEKLSPQEMLSALNRLDNGSGSGCSEKGINLGASSVRSEGTGTVPIDVALSVSSLCKMDLLAEECAKCLRKRRLVHDSLEQELCCCLFNSVNDIDGSKDRGQCGAIITAEFAEELCREVKQSDALQSTCVICNYAGELLHCSGKGCRRSYHSRCSLNPEMNIALPNWYCFDCTKKRLVLGAHSVSQGIESILDVREVDVSNSEGREKQKQCFVKYKGLAHIHNRWVPEILVVHEAPELCTKIRKQKEDTQWNPALAVPHRLLRRRSVIIDDKHINQEVSIVSNSQQEWLVKWCGLDYDQATWESEDSSFFKKPEAQRLIEEYETRQNKAREKPLSGSNEAQEKRKDPLVKLGRHMIGGTDSCYLNSVNKLREYQHKGHNAVLLDEQDRFVKVIHLISSLKSHVCRPFLIICPYASLPSWEAEFVHLASSINVVVYGGNADARHIIRSLEFYEEGGKVMLQVLLSSAEAIAEDVEELKGIEWEAVIIDDCQQSCILSHSGCIMNLATDWRLLLMNAQLKDNIVDYINILSLLEPGSSFNKNSGLVANSSEGIKVLKDKLSSFIICARFLEYWVPVEISNVQLELYCYSLLSKSSVLRTFCKSDPVGSLREILISLRKCCDHPYIVDWQLQASVSKGLSPDAMLDADIRASGKLHFLETLLLDLKNQELKVLILFQSTSGSGRDSTGLVLEDFLRRFGEDSFEHVASGLIPSKKQAACNQFNSLRERSFLLLETRACSPIIKLSVVDAVILFDSDWNPHNDLRALQKITIDSKLEQIKVFRLYCPCTVEEKVLILAKNDMTLDSTLQSIIPTTSHMLLMWGSSNLFLRLDEFHHDSCKDNIVFGSSFLTDVSKEIVSLFQNHKNFYSSKYISVARQNGGCYLKCIPLIGEQKIQQPEVPPHVFWTELLEGKQPQWKYISGSSQRNRKRVHYSEELPSEDQSDEASKRRKKMDGTKIVSSSWQAEPRLEKSISGNKQHQEKSGTSLITNSESMGNDNPSFLKNIGLIVTSGSQVTPSIAEVGDIKHMHNEQRGLLESLKPTLSNLCEALLLKDDEKRLVEQFLEHLIKNYRVTREPETTLQAFLLSVCWTAAEELKKKFDRQKWLTIARERVGFTCSECEAEDIYAMLKPKMGKFSCLGIKNSESKGNFIESQGNPKNLELEESSLGVDCLKDFEKNMKKVEKGCGKQMERLKNRHNEEIEKFEKSREELKVRLEQWCKLESASIRYTHANSSVGIDKLKALDNDYAKKREELEKQMSICRKELEARQKIEKDEEEKRIAGYMERAKALGQRKLLVDSHAKSGVNSQVAEPIELGKDSNGTVGINGNLPTQQNSEREATVSVLAENSENTHEQRVSCRSDESRTPLENVPASKEPSNSICPPECTPTIQLEKITNQMDDVVVDRSTVVESDHVVVDRSTVVESDQINGTSTTGPLLSPAGSFTEQTTADTNQGLGDESQNGVGEQVGHTTEAHNTLSQGKTASINCSNRVPSDLLHNGGTSSSTEASFTDWITRYNDQIGVAPNCRLDIWPIENHSSIVGTAMPRNQDHNSPRVLGVAVSQPISQLADHLVPTNFAQQELNVSVARGALPAHASHPNRVQGPLSTNSRVSNSNNFDPLQNELDRLHKEIGNIVNIHEQKKSQLKSECEKEIEDLVAQIKRKYDKKLDEAEASFLLKRNELETCQNKVVMHKMLAEAFRSKCTDYKAATRMQQPGNPSSSAESFSQIHSTRHFSPAGPYPSTLPATGTPCAAPPFRSVRPSMTLSSQARISHINPAASTTRQQQVSREARAPAPHLQPFRSASSAISSSSMPSGDVLVLRPPNNQTSTSAMQLPPQPPPFPPPSQLNAPSQSHQEESMGRGMPLNLSLSATELLMDITRRHDTNLHQCSSNVPPLPDNVRNSESWDISQFEEATNLQPPSSNLLAGDVVCLSDDD